MVLAACEQAQFVKKEAAPTPASFDELFASYKDRVYSIAFRFSGDPTTALDISQQVFLKLLRNLHSYRGEAAFDSWLYRMVVNCCLDHQRLNWRWLPFVQEAIDLWQARGGAGIDPDALDLLVLEEKQAQVRQAVGALPPDLRIVVVLRYTESLAYDEIANILKIPAGTVASRLNRAHKLLEKRLAAHAPPKK